MNETEPRAKSQAELTAEFLDNFYRDYYPRYAREHGIPVEQINSPEKMARFERSQWYKKQIAARKSREERSRLGVYQGEPMTRKPFAGMYRCSCGYKGAQYFFDSKPVETVCGRCDGMAKLVREIAAPDTSAATEANKKRKAA